ncbi:MAG: hypothetical protein JXN61_04440 [Sedimentisphaerales bacterium]|nr:hypothetical protein [Sedimentisphaerales bacterium]
MSTLTKVLIVLLTVSSIFLCGTVATYVGSANNYKELYQTANSQLGKIKRDIDLKNAEVNEVKSSTEQAKAALQAKIGSLESELITVKGQLDQAENRRDQLLNDVDQLTSKLDALAVTNDKWHVMLQNAQTELTKVNADLTKERSQNKEVTTAILEKMAIIAQLEDQTKELNKEKEQLQSKLVLVLRQFGKTVEKPAPVTTATMMAPAVADKAQPRLPGPSVEPVGTQVKEIGLKGVVTQVDLKNSLAEISIGAADGVKEKMKFYATRGDSFICEILILDVYAERAVGFLERVQTPPKSGDSISTSIGS